MLDFFIFKPLFTVASIKEMETQAPVTYQVWVDPTAEANTFIILIFPQWMIFSQLIDASKHIVYTVLAQVAVLYKAMHYVLSHLAFGLKSDVSCFLFYEKTSMKSYIPAYATGLISCFHSPLKLCLYIFTGCNYKMPPIFIGWGLDGTTCKWRKKDIIFKHGSILAQRTMESL